MEYIEIQKVRELSDKAIDSVRELLDYVQERDINLYRHVYMCWDKLCNVKSASIYCLKRRPVCPDRSNCPGWIQGHGCDNCNYRPS